MRLIFITISAVFITACASTPPVQSHPYFGKWTWTRAKNSCTEIYENRPDHTSKVISGQEISESRFTISDEPEQSGFYKVTDEVTFSNGKPDCTDSPTGTPIGDKVTAFVFIRPSGNEMLVCQYPSLDSCLFALTRVSK